MFEKARPQLARCATKKMLCKELLPFDRPTSPIITSGRPKRAVDSWKIKSAQPSPKLLEHMDLPSAFDLGVHMLCPFCGSGDGFIDGACCANWVASDPSLATGSPLPRLELAEPCKAPAIARPKRSSAQLTPLLALLLGCSVIVLLLSVTWQP